MTYYIASSSVGLGSKSRDPDHPSFPSHEQPIASGSYLSMPEHEPSPFRSGSSITTASSPGEIPSVTEGPPDLEYPAPDFADPQLIRERADTHPPLMPDGLACASLPQPTHPIRRHKPPTSKPQLSISSATPLEHNGSTAK